MIVLDASAAVDMLLREEGVGEWVLERVADEVELAAPVLLDYEFVAALRSMVSARERPLADAERALASLAGLGVVRYPPGDFLPRMWELRDVATVYDAAYVALAEALAAPLVTTDRRLARAHGHAATIEAPPTSS